MALSRKKGKDSLLRSLGFYMIVFATLLLAVGCSTQTRYKVLTFFFTGVPPLEQREAAAADSGTGSLQAAAIGADQKPPPPPFHKHPPFKERNCGACHDTARGNRLYSDPEKLCFRCHEDFAKSFQWVHGPAAVGSCNACHEPHQSKNEFLLISKSKDICFKCHLKEDILSTSYHATAGDQLCTDCHNPHGSTDRRLLKK